MPVRNIVIQERAPQRGVLDYLKEVDANPLQQVAGSLLTVGPFLFQSAAITSLWLSHACWGVAKSMEGVIRIIPPVEQKRLVTVQVMLGAAQIGFGVYGIYRMISD